ncbi:hypothetical protein [Pseudonocardia spinosispora]|uniref:hypothetical protein n=1 Tax=Pseudonocardia spinosispora TaxID=103441 RepID=UPI0004228F81|nr:hypothetical protein [Pseudonocardia spinosispora]
MAVTLPNSTDVRNIRTRTRKVANDQFELVRTPLLAFIGIGDLALHKISELPDRLTADELRQRVDDVAGQARRAYTQLADRGEVRVERIRTEPRVARALRNVEDITERFDRRVDRGVDAAHDVAQDSLNRFSSETRSVGERTARATQRTAERTARQAGEIGDDVADAVRDAGDEAAHTARSTSRKAANRTAPRKPAAR